MSLAITTLAQAAPSGAAVHEAAWIATASTGLDQRALATLARINSLDRRLLALRAYLRAGDTLQERWSWSQQQLAAYPATPEGMAAAADIDAVEQAFARANPGFAAQANRAPRSLEQQLEHWNQSSAVASVGLKLAAAMSSQFPGQATPTADRLRAALMAWVPPSAAPLAAPGLSAHGQGRAFDFQIVHDARPVAGFDAASARREWDAAGWTRKLHAAVIASGKPFSGPLESPYEPWHYAYLPARGR